MIEDGKTGKLFIAEDSFSLAEAALKMFEDSEFMESCVSNGHNYVENVRNWQNTVKCYSPVYDELKNVR